MAYSPILHHNQLQEKLSVATPLIAGQAPDRVGTSQLSMFKPQVRFTAGQARGGGQLNSCKVPA